MTTIEPTALEGVVRSLDGARGALWRASMDCFFPPSRAASTIARKFGFWAVLLGCLLVATAASADGTALPFPGCSCGDPVEPPGSEPCSSCPSLYDDDCEGKDAGAACGVYRVNRDGTCRDMEPLRSTCPALFQTTTGERPTKGDAGTAILYCLKADSCWPGPDANDNGGCRVGGGTSHRGWLAGLPVALMFGGVFLLVVDRRRRRRSRRR